MSAVQKVSSSPHKKDNKEKSKNQSEDNIDDSMNANNILDRSKDFVKELEFVQLLCNPEYLKWLYSEKYFSNPDFKSFLKYLLYFKNPNYIKFLIYPQCIPILELMIDDKVNDLLSEDSFYTQLADIQHSIWKNKF